MKFSTKEKAVHHDNTIVAKKKKKKGMSITMSVYLKSQEKMMIEIFDFYSKKQMMDPPPTLEKSYYFNYFNYLIIFICLFINFKGKIFNGWNLASTPNYVDEQEMVFFPGQGSY